MNPMFSRRPIMEEDETGALQACTTCLFHDYGGPECPCDDCRAYSRWYPRPKSKADLFVEHIQRHLKPGQVVICKICKKTVDEIAREGARP